MNDDAPLPGSGGTFYRLADGSLIDADEYHARLQDDGTLISKDEYLARLAAAKEPAPVEDDPAPVAEDVAAQSEPAPTGKGRGKAVKES